MHWQKQRKNGEQEEFVRVRLPDRDKRELLGIVERLTGAYRMYVKCEDGKIRMCRVPGGLRRRLWVNDGYYVLVRKWELEGDTRGDVIDTYHGAKLDCLRKKGYLKELEQGQ